jgi:hypothetical protein
LTEAEALRVLRLRDEHLPALRDLPFASNTKATGIQILTNARIGDSCFSHFFLIVFRSV